MTTGPASAGRGTVSQRLARLVERAWFRHTVTAVILVNAVVLGLETSETAMAAAGSLLLAIDRLCLAVFVVELALKLAAWRHRFFTSGWNIFDFLIVGISLAPASGPLSVLRALRVLRVLRLLSVVPQLRTVVQALLGALPGMASVIAVLLLVFYVGAVLATKLYGADPHPDMQAWFGTVGRSMYTLFQVMTLESWSMGIVRPTMALYPNSWLFFVPFIVLTSFAVLNLFIALIVSAMEKEARAEAEAERAAAAELAEETAHKVAHEEAAPVLAELSRLRREIADLRRDLRRDEPAGG